MTKIAIVGLSCLFPGADTPARFWEALARGEQTTTDATAAELGVDPAYFYSPERNQPDTSYFLHGGYVREFEPDSPVDGLDRVHQWAVNVAQAALDDAHSTHDRTRTGVILGNLSFPTRHSSLLFKPLYDRVVASALADVLHAPDFHFGNGYDPNFVRPDEVETAHAMRSPGYPAAMVAALLGLRGPHFALDAACASSLYALELACAYLRAGKADVMLAGAVSAADPLFVNMGFAHLGGYPADGEISRPLDVNSGGLIAGEGAGMFVLKRHGDAVRDGDHIYALVGGVGLSNDGRGKHILSPNSKGQRLALQRAYENAGLPRAGVDYIECHASGTSVGDKTELTTMADFFGDGPIPLIGSVKSNVGHLLTAAGMASMTKLILGMAHGQIPATINNRTPLTSQDGSIGGAQIVTQTVDWQPHTEAPRRAGVNAFGFGGVSAHVILEANERQPVTQPTYTPTEPVRMAITGMDAHFGKLDGLQAFNRALYKGEDAFVPLPEDRWRGLQHRPELLARFGLEAVPDGAYIESFDLDFMQYNIPPNPADEPIPQQLLLLKVADKAVRDASLQRGGNVAVLVALGTELALHQYRGRADLNWQVKQALADAGVNLTPEQTAELETIAKDALLTPAQVNHYTSYIGNITASRVAALWDFNGPAFTISAEENSTFKALEVAELLLREGKVEAVVVGAVDLAGGAESVLTRNMVSPLHNGDAVAAIDTNANGWMIGEGAGAVVLQRAADAPSAYATIDAISIQRAAVEQAAREALAAADVTPAGVGYLELHASGIADETQAELDGLSAVYGGGDTPETALGTVKANIGHTFAASGMASLLKATLAISGRYIPAIPNWKAPDQPEALAGLWAAHKSRGWFDSTQVAAVSGLSGDGSAAHLVLSNRVKGTRRAAPALRGDSPYMLPVSGRDAGDLVDKLQKLRDDLDDDPADLADRTYARYDAAAGHAVAIVGRDAAELRKQIDAAMAAIPHGNPWTTPTGSTYTPRPVGRSGSVTFVYPGAFNTYPKLGYDLLPLFPALYDALKTVREDVGAVLNERLLYPRTLSKPGPKDTRRMKEDLGDDPTAMVESGLAFALLYSRLMRDVFKINPASAFGYSLGEGSMMWGLGVWRDGDAGNAALEASPLFTDRLAGPMNAIREAWGIPADVPPDEFWAAYFIPANVEKVKAAAQHENKVYVTHINTPREVMIAGSPAACERVVDAVGVEAMRAPFSVAIHNPAMMSAFDEFRKLHNLPTHPVEGVRFYSAADYEPITLERQVIATSIARMACASVDFPRLIERAYADGARVFIELGPRSTCARWVEETLGERPHVAVSVDNMGMDDYTSIVRMLARLVAHRVPLDLSAFYNPIATTENKRSLVRTVTLGGQDVYAAIATDENRAKFAEVAQQSQQPVTTRRMTALPDDIHRVHAEFLRTRQDSLRQMSEVIAMQMQTDGTAPTTPPQVTQQPVQPSRPALKPPPAPRPNTAPSVEQGVTPQYNHDRIEDFAVRRVADCYGERYAIYDDRRAPRIPNGDLLLVTRAIDITGERFVSKPGTSIHAEYEVPVDTWWYRDNPYPTMPYLIYMEIALQPSGFLSAHHGPTLEFPDTDFYFRNLDGYGVLHDDVDMRGRTITNHVTMLGSTTMSGIIIQKFDFKMYDGERLFYEGEATFGYFTLQALDSQAGLDAGKQTPRWIDTVDLDPAQVVTLNPRAVNGEGYLSLPRGDGMLAFTDEIKIVPGGGKYDAGYAYANTIIDPTAWFFKAHFHQDPVMPGSIGVETIMQALQAYAIETGLGADFDNPHFAQLDGGHKISWRYRGQILSDSDKSHVEANIKEIRREPGRVVVIADASLWRDKLRIYEVTDIGLTIVEG